MKIYSMRDHSNNFKLAGTPAGQPAKISGFAKSFAFSDANMQTRFSDFLAGIIINDVWGVVRLEILTLSFGEIHRLSWVIYHTEPFLDRSMSWPSAQEIKRNGLGIFFHTLTSRICHLQLCTPFHNRPAVSEVGSLEKAASWSHHLQFHPGSLSNADLKRLSVCSIIKTRNFAREQFISSSLKLERIFVQMGYLILNICCCSMLLALFALTYL